MLPCSPLDTKVDVQDVKRLADDEMMFLERGIEFSLKFLTGQPGLLVSVVNLVQMLAGGSAPIVLSYHSMLSWSMEGYDGMIAKP